MRVRSSASFPHPVLSESTGDYAQGSFELSLTLDEAPAAGGAILRGEIVLDEPSIAAMCEVGHARAGLMVTCPDTYFDHFVPCSPGPTAVDLSHGEVRGLVYVSGVVIAVRDNLALSSDAVSDEFLQEARFVRSGEFIALTKEYFFEVGLEKLAPLESIFRLRQDDELAEGSVEIDFDSESIEIYAAPRLFQFFTLFREHTSRDVLLSALYVPVVMSALDAIRSGEFADRRWFAVINARCNAEGLDCKGDLFEVAQKLLDGPLASLRKTFERAD